MHSFDNSALTAFLSALLRPVVRFSLKHAIKLQQIFELLKRVYVEVAHEELLRLGKKATTSQLSVTTGIHRKDLIRLEREARDTSSTSKGTLITKILGQWQNDKRFRTKQGEPRVLSCATPESEFTDLVHTVSKDVSPSAILFELERSSSVIKTPHGIKLSKRSYTPVGDLHHSTVLLERELKETISAIEENLFTPEEIKNLHAATTYDKVRAEAVPEIRQWLLREGHLFHERARSYISQFDQDINPVREWKGETAKIWLATISHTDQDE